jgi:flagellar M-ring protein FliF
MEQGVNYLNRYFPGLARMRGSQKLALLVAMLLAVGLLFWGIYQVRQVEYRVLYSNLTPADSGMILAKLKEKKIPYRLSADGTSISIPSHQVGETRLEFAAAGLPQGGGVGFEIFDQRALGATDFEQQVNYRRALQGELARTINSLEEIEASRVHIALPKESVFAERRKKPTASVSLRLRPGRTLSASQVDGISQLVASSVEGMSAQDVIVVDGRGNILSQRHDDEAQAKLSTTQRDYQRRLEKELASNLQSLLEQVVGAGKAQVRVATEINFAQTERLEEVFDAENPVVRSTQKQTERTLEAAGAEAGPGSEKTSEILNYEISKVTSKTILPMGEVKKLSIAAVVDGTQSRNAQGALEYQPRTAEEMASLEQLIMKSAGFNQERGDQVVITNIPFQRPMEEGEMPALTWQDYLAMSQPFLKYLFILLIFLAGVFLLVRPLIRVVLRSRELPAEAGRPAALPVMETAPVMPGELNMTGERVMDEVEVIRRLAEKDPKKMSDLLKAWLK